MWQRRNRSIVADGGREDASEADHGDQQREERGLHDRGDAGASLGVVPPHHRSDLPSAERFARRHLREQGQNRSGAAVARRRLDFLRGNDESVRTSQAIAAR